MSKLESMIKQASQKYYSDGSSEYTDSEFDKMLEDLKEENPDSKLLTDVGHGYDINQDSTYGVRRKHKYGDIIGLEKCHNWRELRSEFKDEDCVYYITPKIDGMSIVCYFKDSQLDMALTRGSRDGDTGIDVTDKVKYITEFHNMFHFTYKFTGAIRGEIVMSQEKFEDITDKYPQGFDGKKPFSNPRNTTAGIMNRKGFDKRDLEYLDILFYYVVGDENGEYFSNLCDNDSYGHMMSWLYEEVNTSNIVPMHVTKLYEDTFEEKMSDLKHILDLSNFGLEEYPTDGLVINKSLHYNDVTCEITYDAQAFKFPAESCKTNVKDVIWNLSKTHYLIPIVEVEPVQLSGTSVTYATGFNADWIQMNKVSKGATVTITKSGEIIPYILDVEPSDEISGSYVPLNCPECGHKLEREGVHLICTNEQCPNALKQDVMEWVNHLVPMDNFGDKLRLKYLHQMLDPEFNVESLMFKLNNYKVANGSIQDNMFQEFLNRLSKDEFTLQQALEALNVPRLGEITSQKLSLHKDIVEQVINNTQFPMDQLTKIVGQATTLSILQNKWKFKRLTFIWNRVKSNEIEFKGKVAITGKLSVKRKYFEEELKSKGYLPGNISKDCKFLITDDPNSSSSKNAQATKWGIQKITEEDFRKQYLN